ncbi:MAG: efflux RND transporter periplasmic adaptor subunit [Bacteroidales bacterium]|nr:efflux RND transporter periplasmic adaptor subunit [Bacteroidales bacterium]
MNRIFVPITIVLSLLAASCGSKAPEKERTSLPTMTIALSSADIETQYAAHLKGKQMVEVRPQVEGVITRICINEGDRVSRGQLLFVIDQVPYRAALDVATANVKAAEAALATARLKLKSNETLYSRNVISDYDLQLSRNEVSTAESALALAKAQETSARNNLSYTEITSPMDGVAGMIPYHVGALVANNMEMPLVTLSDDATVQAYFSLNEAEALNLLQQYGSSAAFLRNAPPVGLVMSNGTRYDGNGKIDAISGIVDASTGAITLRASFENNKRLLPGGGSARVVVMSHRDSVIVIPKAATFELQNRVFVYRVLADTCSATPVEVAKINDGTTYIVESGLNVGDCIVSDGAGLVKEGTKVK